MDLKCLAGLLSRSVNVAGAPDTSGTAVQAHR
jgi:hypothetical protein